MTLHLEQGGMQRYRTPAAAHHAESVQKTCLLYTSWARIQFIEPRYTEFLTWCSHTVADTIDLTMEKLSKVYEQCVECPLYRTKEFKQHYLRDVMSDSLGYAGTEIIRRVVGDSKVMEMCIRDSRYSVSTIRMRFLRTRD